MNQGNKRDYYEMRRGKDTLCSGTVPNLGYSAEWIRDMERFGIFLFKNGKRVRSCVAGCTDI